MVSKYSEREKVFIRELVKDCINWNLKENEALEYIRGRFKREISLATYNRYKSSTVSDKSVTSWYNTFTRVGFLIEHKLAIDRIQSQIETLTRLFAEENFKPSAPSTTESPRHEWKDKKLMLDISARLESLEITLDNFRQGNAILKKMRDEFERIKSIHQKYNTV